MSVMETTKPTTKKRRLRPVDRTFIRAFSSYTPPADLTVSQWAEGYRVLSRESSAEAGPWRNSRTPYLVEPMDAFSDPRVRHLTMVASSQVGKSEFILNCIGYAIDQDPGSMLYIQPNIEDAKKFSRRRIAPMVRDCPTLKRKVADAKGRDSANTVQEKSFPGGALSIIGSNSPAALASTPVRYIFGDERDRWALSAGTEGDPWKLADARTITYYNAKLVDVSTCTVKGASSIADAFDDGTQERWKHQCPHCGEWHEIPYRQHIPKSMGRRADQVHPRGGIRKGHGPAKRHAHHGHGATGAIPGRPVSGPGHRAAASNAAIYRG